MKILVTGDREYHNRAKVKEVLDRYFNGFQVGCIIQGGARGADTLAKEYAKEHGICCVQVDANWDYYHKPAGPIRNGWMLKFCEPDIVIAFHTHLVDSRGTKNMIEISRRVGLEVVVIEE